MPLDLIVVPRRDEPVLAAVLSSERRRGKELLDVVAEDGATFRFPAEQALARQSLATPGLPADPAIAVAAVRAGLEPFATWLALRATVEDAAVLTFAEAAEAAELDGPDAVLRLALGSNDAAPWFRRKGGLLHAVPMRDALMRLMEIRLAAFRHAGDDALVAWWPDRAAGAPESWGGVHDAVDVRARVMADRARFVEPDYAVDVGAAAAEALRALVEWAIAGDAAETSRGQDLARRAGLPDGPDVALEQLVECGVIPADVEPAPVRAGLASPFSPEALEEAAAADPSSIGSREDLTEIFTVAIDDADTREVDDAVSLREVDDGWELLVHVVDVAAAVPAGGALDAAVRQRATSLYLPDRSVYMLPSGLGIDRQSLVVGAPRAAVTAFLRIDAEGRLQDARFARTLVQLDRRTTYDESRDPATLGSDAEAGACLVRLGEALRAERVRRGARITRLPSLRVDVSAGRPGDGGEVSAVTLGLRQQDAPGDVVVSEAMVLCNAAAGAALEKAKTPALFRSQEAGLPVGREMPHPDDPLFALRVRRTFQPVVTKAEPAPHAGLAADAYAQCTSPLRRYGDLVNQRQLMAAVAGEPAPHSVADIEALVPHLHERERTARSAGEARKWVWVARAIAASGRTTLRGILSRGPRHGHGNVWVPELCRDLPLRVPKTWRPPRIGTESDWPVRAIHPWRGRIELGPSAPPPETV